MLARVQQTRIDFVGQHHDVVLRGPGEQVGRRDHAVVQRRPKMARCAIVDIVVIEGIGVLRIAGHRSQVAGLDFGKADARAGIGIVAVQPL